MKKEPPLPASQPLNEEQSSLKIAPSDGSLRSEDRGAENRTAPRGTPREHRDGNEGGSARAESEYHCEHHRSRKIRKTKGGVRGVEKTKYGDPEKTDKESNSAVMK